MTADLREKALAHRHQIRHEQLSQHTRELQPLPQGTTVQVQNQTGPHANKWDISGIIVEVLDHQSYMVKMDGSGRVSKRNRRFLRPIKPYRYALLPSDLPSQAWQHAEPQPSHSSSNNSHYTGSTADKAGRPSNTAAQQERAVAGNTSGQLDYTDPWSEEVTMTDDDFNEGLLQAAYNVLTDEITDKMPEAIVKLPPIQLSKPDSAQRSSKRVKFAPKRLIAQ